MKNLNILFAICSGICLFTSCLGDGGHVIYRGSQPGITELVIDGDEEKTFIYVTGDERVLPTNSSSLQIGDGRAILFNYTIDFDASENKKVGKDGYYTVEMSSTTPTTLNKYTAFNTLHDTSQMIENERSINTFEKRYAFIRNNLFLYTKFNIDSVTIHNDYNLSYIPDQIAPVDTTVNASVYELFLRVQRLPEEEVKTNETSFLDVNTFTISDFVTRFGAIEKNKDSSNMYVRIKYVRSFNQDAPFINWGESEIFKIPLR